jgi:hypothetical protein
VQHAPDSEREVTSSLSNLLEALPEIPRAPAVPSEIAEAPPASHPAPSSHAPISQPPKSSSPAPSIPPSSFRFTMPPVDLTGIPAIEDVMRQRVRLGQGQGPLWAFLLVAIIATFAVVSGVSSLWSAVLTRTTAPTTPSAAASSSAKAPSVGSSRPAPTPAPEAPTPTAPGAEKSIIERAESGDSDAISELEKRPAIERSVAEDVALTHARAALKRKQLAVLAAEPAGAEVAQKLKKAMDDPDTASEALRVMAELQGSLGPDLLFYAWTNRKKADPIGELAGMLLQNPDVRKKASPALAVAIDLRLVESCDLAKDAVKRAIDSGDRRSGQGLGRFTSKSGCGDNKHEDCWSCLRDGDELKSAQKAISKRAPPKI